MPPFIDITKIYNFYRIPVTSRLSVFSTKKTPLKKSFVARPHLPSWSLNKLPVYLLSRIYTQVEGCLRNKPGLRELGLAATYSIGQSARQSYRLSLNIDSANGLGNLILALSNAVIRAEVISNHRDFCQPYSRL